MTKYCGYCGAPNEDDAKFCGNCSKALEDRVTYTHDKKDSIFDTIKNNLHVIIPVGAVAAVVIVAVVVVRALFFSSGYDSIIKKTMKSMNNYDVSTLVSISSSYASVLSSYDLQEYYDDLIVDYLENFDDSVGYGYTIEYKVVSEYTMSSAQLTSMLNSQSYWLDYSGLASSIDSMAVATVQATATNGALSDYQTIQIYMTKENGKWKLFTLYYS
ncbi:MAG: zinc ribbon domain-containing protein [Erysipelotrichaceae bacterium]|nr:zinc ribbon domain-containing protein [Erysipelotrichaceae bacterium]